MATKKTDAQVKAAMAKVEAAKVAETVKETVAKPAAEKKTATKAAAKPAAEKKTATKAAAKPAAEKKTATKAAVKPAAEKKAATKTTAAQKAPAKKTTAKATQTVFIQCCGYEVTTADITAKVVAAVGKKTVKELNIYVKPEEGMVYYTADGEQGSIAL